MNRDGLAPDVRSTDRLTAGLTATKAPFSPALGEEDSVCHLSHEEKSILMVGCEPCHTSAAGPGVMLWLRVAVGPPGGCDNRGLSADSSATPFLPKAKLQNLLRLQKGLAA